jgi:hypothetical protein
MFAEPNTGFAFVVRAPRNCRFLNVAVIDLPIK